jgi:hypothetical protein
MNTNQREIWLPALLLIATTSLGGAQTLIDLSTQTKNPDFSNFLVTKPFTVKSVLPPTCSQGQVLFNPTTSPGQNLYFCTATNVWSPQAGAPTAGASFLLGFGLVSVFFQGLTYVSVDTGTLLSRASAQASISSFCQSNTGTTAYACSLSPILQGYVGPASNPPGSTCLVLYVDTTNTGAATIDADTLGPVPIVERSGSPLIAGDIPAKQPVFACFNGAAFVLQH